MGIGRNTRKSWYTVLDVHEHFYWTMGAPINYSNGSPCTILINRKPLSCGPAGDHGELV